MTRDELKIQLSIIDRFREFRKFPERVSYDDRFTLLKFMYWLTWEGFEKYIADYFKEFEWMDVTKVTWWYNDKCIDVKCQKWNKKIGIQCKNRSQLHIKRWDILYFLEETKGIKKQLWNTLSLYYITTNRLNQDARHLANENWIHVKYYKDIILMNKKMNIDYFIKTHKTNNKLIRWNNINEILEKFYYNKWLKSRWLWTIMYFIIKKIYPLFCNKSFELDFDKAENESQKDDLLFLSK